MSRQPSASTWPFIAVLACLFVLSATAPRLWEQRARDRAARRAAVQAQRSEAVRAESAALQPAEPEPLPTMEVAAAPVPVVGPQSSAAVAEYQVVVPSERIARQAVPSSATSPTEPIEDEEEPVEVANRPSTREAISPDVPRVEPEIPAFDLPLSPRGPGASPPGSSNEPAPAETTADPSAVAECWPVPVALLEHLDELQCECETGCWAMAVERAVTRLGKAIHRGGPEALRGVARLAQLRQDGEMLASQLDDVALAAKVRRACYALDRRHRLWEETAKAGGLKAPADDGVVADPQRLALCLGQVDALTQASPEGRLWSQYLTLDALGQLAARRGQD
ncbi:MAG: hypothetical protein NUV77_15975, partial [Thermoguttaceae bacterium]|nr:hypothetical protein [Thermoguttaceae bacterium]